MGGDKSTAARMTHTTGADCLIVLSGALPRVNVFMIKYI